MSEWTITTLKEHFEAILIRIDKAVAAALVAVKEENRKTEVAAEKRFDLLNELREGVATKEQFEALEKVVNALGDRLTKLESVLTGSAKGSDKTLNYILMALVAANIVYTVVKG